jgi:hypothetical protein
VPHNLHALKFAHSIETKRSQSTISSELDHIFG